MFLVGESTTAFFVFDCTNLTNKLEQTLQRTLHQTSQGSMSNLHKLCISILKSNTKSWQENPEHRKEKPTRTSVRTSNPAPPNQSWSPPPAPVLPVVPLRATMPRIAALPQRHRRRWQRLPKVLDLRACRQHQCFDASMFQGKTCKKHGIQTSGALPYDSKNICNVFGQFVQCLLIYEPPLLNLQTNAKIIGLQTPGGKSS